MVRKGLFFILLLVFFLWARLASAKTATAVTVDLSQTGRSVPSLLFGDQIQWPGFGQDLLQVASATPSTGMLRTDVLDQLHAAGLTILRYPGGTLSDFFHWEVSTGPYAGRLPQMTLNLQTGSATQYQTEVPYFGADEFTQTAQYLGAEMLITANAGTGTASEAANWLTYYKSKGITPKYWEIGNEVYLPGNTPSGDYLLDAVHVTAAQYASLFDAYASALRAVDPAVQVGMVGVHISAPGLDNWNQIVLQNVHQKIDFMAVHNSYAPQDSSSDNNPDIYAATLAAPTATRANFDLIEQDISAYAPAQSRGMTIAVTEHAALFTPPASVSDIPTEINDISRSQSLAGALYSALLFNIYFRDPSIQIANHINPLTSAYQALLNVKLPNLPGLPGYDSSQPLYPQGYEPNPIASAYYDVFRLYADASGGSIVAASIAGSPTFNSTAIGNVPAENNVPSLDVVAVMKTGSTSMLYVYVVNRDLSQAIPATMQIANLSTQIQLTSADQVNGADYRSANTQTTPNAVQRVTVPAGGLLSGEAFTFPAHSLTRFTFTIGTIASLDQIAIYPNPLRPAQGETHMHFENLPAGCRLRIYTLAGEKVKDLTVDSAGAAAWDGTNQAGNKAASGVYFALVEGAGDKKTYKVAIQR